MKNCRMTILKLGKDSPESGEHSRYPESMSGLPSKDFLTNLQKPYFFEKAFFYTCLAYNNPPPKDGRFLSVFCLPKRIVFWYPNVRHFKKLFRLLLYCNE